MSSSQHGSGTRSHLYSHRTGGCAPPAAGTLVPQALVSPEGGGSPPASNAVAEEHGRKSGGERGEGRAEGVQCGSRRCRDTGGTWGQQSIHKRRAGGSTRVQTAAAQGEAGIKQLLSKSLQRKDTTIIRESGTAEKEVTAGMKEVQVQSGTRQ